ncbi:hypothetical protein B0H16DRAFT_1895864, partial [Mycena metata]
MSSTHPLISATAHPALDRIAQIDSATAAARTEIEGLVRQLAAVSSERDQSRQAVQEQTIRTQHAENTIRRMIATLREERKTAGEQTRAVLDTAARERAAREKIQTLFDNMRKAEPANAAREARIHAQETALAAREVQVRAAEEALRADREHFAEGLNNVQKLMRDTAHVQAQRLSVSRNQDTPLETPAPVHVGNIPAQSLLPAGAARKRDRQEDEEDEKEVGSKLHGPSKKPTIQDSGSAFDVSDKVNLGSSLRRSTRPRSSASGSVRTLRANAKGHHESWDVVLRAAKARGSAG